jgi:hypothetical protein
MRVGIVEGEPGIFPDPIARVLRGFGRLFGRRDPDGPKHSESDEQDGAADKEAT